MGGKGMVKNAHEHAPLYREPVRGVSWWNGKNRTPSGRALSAGCLPRAAPWAITFRPFEPLVSRSGGDVAMRNSLGRQKVLLFLLVARCSKNLAEVMMFRRNGRGRVAEPERSDYRKDATLAS